MTDPKQLLYDILGETFKFGVLYGEEKSGHITVAEILFPLTARMEEEMARLIKTEREDCAKIAMGFAGLAGLSESPNDIAEYIGRCIRQRSLPSSPERET